MQVGFHEGDNYITSNDKVYTIAHLSSTSVFFEGETPSDTPLALPLTEFKAKIQKQELQYQLELSTDVDTLTKYQERHFSKRAPYLTTLKDLADSGMRPTSKDTYLNVCARVQQENHICKHPGFSTLCKWWCAFKNADYRINKSLPKTPIQPKRLNDNSEKKMKKYIATTLINSAERNIAKGFEQYKIAIEKMGDSSIHIVSESTFRRRLSQLKKYEKLQGEGNHNKMKRNQRTYLSSIEINRVLERVEMDRAHFNFAVIDDETGKPIGPVSIYVAIDCYSRYPVGITLEYNQAEDSRGAVNLVKQLFIPVSDKLNAYGQPETLIGDNGPGFHSRKMDAIIENLKVEYIRAPSGQPWKKPFVESFFNTLRLEFFDGTGYTNNKEELCLGLPGYLGKRTYKGNQYLTEESTLKAARIKASDFERILKEWLIHYVTSTHSRLDGMTPQEKWDESVQRDCTAQPKYDDIAHHFRAMEKQGTIQQRGYINFNYQVFSSRNLKAVYDAIAVGKDDKDNPDVVIKYDLDDARHITVNYIEPKSNTAMALIVPNKKYGSLDKPISFEAININSKNNRRPLFETSFTPIKPKGKQTKKGKQGISGKNFHQANSTKEYVDNLNKKVELTAKQKTDKNLEQPIENNGNSKSEQIGLDFDCYSDSDWKDKD